ncbi:MAG TPA: alpha/beta fold hydrolase [Deltaproteobacteria bacterium]|nr:alpha/beta fold hydrolase [Deltaproteobacteria bacterium]
MMVRIICSLLAAAYPTHYIYYMLQRHKRTFQVDAQEYPFEDHWLEKDGTALHFIDEGDGVPVLMLHGNPTWSFLYRRIIVSLRGKCRCIAPDYPGFGYSGHPPAYSYTPEEHARWIKALIESLRIDRCILVVQDWGGPIGLSLAVDHPGRFAGIVLCNSWCWPPMLNALIFSWIMGGPLGNYLHLRHNFFARVIVPWGIYHKETRLPSVLKAYTDPFPTPESRMGTYVFPRSIRTSSAWLKDIESRLYMLRNKPVYMVWAMKDPAFGKKYYIRRWKKYFPDARLDMVSDASHYLQEDCPERVVNAIENVLKILK